MALGLLLSALAVSADSSAAAVPASHASLRFDLHPLPGGGAVVAGGSF